MTRARDPIIWFVFALPPLVLALWAAFYLQQWWAFFDKPLADVEFSYEGQKGRVVGHAGSAIIDLRRGWIDARNVEVSQAGYGRFVQAQHATLALPLPWNVTSSYAVTVTNADLHLMRYRDGSWNFQDVAPKPSREGPSDVGYVVGGDNVRVRFRDEYVSPTKVWTARLDDLYVAGAGDAADIRSYASADDVGTGWASLVIADKRLSFMKLRGLNVNPLPVRRYLLTLPGNDSREWLSSWNAARTSYKGDAAFVFGDELQLSGRGVADVTGFRYADYPVVDGRFAGDFTNIGAHGRLIAFGKGVRVDGNGSVLYSEPHGWFDGRVYAANAEALARWKIVALPKGLRWRDASYSGHASWDGKVGLSGNASARYVRFGENEAYDVTGRLTGGGDIIRVSGVRGRALDTTLFADGAITLGKRPSLTGQLFANNLDLTLVPNLPSEYVKGGRFDLKVLVSGPIADLQATVRASGDALIALRDEDSSRLEAFDFALTGTVIGDSLRIDAGTASGRSGLLQGTGTVALDGSRLDLKVSADSIDLASIPFVDFGGLGFADMRVFGSTKRVRMNGLVEAYSASVGDISIPFVSARTLLDGKQLLLEDIVGRSGVSLITGSAAINLGNRKTVTGQGAVADLGVGEITGDVVQGLAQGTWKLGGTLESPIVEAELAGAELVVDKLALRDVTAKGRWSEGALRLDRAEAKLDKGQIIASGNWSPTGASAIVATLEGIDARSLSPYLEGAVELGGLISGTAELRFTDGLPKTGSGELSLQDVSVNGQIVGSGFVQAALNDKRISASGAIGSLESYFVLDSAEFDWEKRALKATLSTLGADLQDSLAITRAALKNKLEPDVAAELAKIEGTYALKGSIATSRDEAGVWTLDGADISLATTAMTYGGDEFGTFSLNATKVGSRYEIPLLQWTGGPASLRLSGADKNFIIEDGTMSLDGDISDIDLRWLSKFEPRLSELTGRLDTSFSVSGQTASPEILLTANGRELTYKEFAADTFSLGPIRVRDGLISGKGEGPVGKVAVRGFEAQLAELRLPFKYPFEVPTMEQLYARIVVPSRDINDLSKFFGGLDTAQTSGRLSGGDFVVSGTRENLVTTGSIEVIADKLKFTDFDTALRGVAAKVSLADSKLNLSLNAQSEMGGTASAKGGIDLANRALIEPTSLVFDGFGFSYQLGPRSRARGNVSANLILSGDALEPLVTGTVTGNDAALSLAGEMFSRAPSSDLAFNPFFDVVLQLMRGTVSSSLLQAKVSGAGKLQGPLRQTDLAMEFAIDDGEINLPSGRVRVERGGTASFKYGTDFRGETTATLFLDVNANTRITADAGFGPQRYLISLHITGDLLSEDELNIDAESDPPDLSKAQILSILGQQKLFEDVVAAGTGGDFNSQVKGLLTSVLAPAVLGQLTRSLERTFGLEYIGLDFSPAGFGGVTLSKALGKGFSLEYRRVVEQFALTGEPLEEIRLSYRPLTSDPLLGRLKFSVAADRDGLLRVTLGYTRRF